MHIVQLLNFYDGGSKQVDQIGIVYILWASYLTIPENIPHIWATFSTAKVMK
jgi:hypothetical protein